MALEQTQQTISNIKEKLVDTVSATIDQAHQTVDTLLADERVAQAREFVATEAAVASGYKDQIVGQVKETVGHLMGDTKMEREGHQQKLQGQSAAGATATGEEDRAEVTDTIIKRHALMAEVERAGGADKCHLKHVEVHEPEVGQIVAKDEFKLKQFDKAPLLDEIREGKTKKPLVHVEPTEKGLLKTVAIDDKNISEHIKTNKIADLQKEIKTADPRNLNQVSDELIHDRSGARLDVLKSVSSAAAKREEIVKQIGSGAAATQVALKHVETEDKSKPDLSAASLTKTKKLNKAQLLDEVRQGADLKHVETVDKSTPAIEGDVSLKTWNKEGFLAEVREGAELRRI